MDTFFLIVTALFTVTTVCFILHEVKLRRKLKTETETVRIGKNMTLVWIKLIVSCMFILMWALNIYFVNEEIQRINYFSSDIDTTPAIKDEYRDTIRDAYEKKKKKLNCTENYYILFAVMAGTTALMYLYELKFVRHFHVSAKGVYLRYMYIPSEKLRYAINDDTLELYMGKNRNPIVCSITEDQERLENILSENYTEYTEQTEQKKAKRTKL